jgi:hypothetical protein
MFPGYSVQFQFESKKKRLINSYETSQKKNRGYLLYLLYIDKTTCSIKFLMLPWTEFCVKTKKIIELKENELSIKYSSSFRNFRKASVLYVQAVL